MLGGMVDLQKLKSEKKASPEKFKISPHSYAPYYIQMPPVSVSTSPANIYETSLGKLKLEPEIKIFSLGVISIKIVVDFDDKTLTSLKKYFDLNTFENGIQKNIGIIFEELYRDVNDKITTALTDRYDIHVPPETYLAFCVHDPEGRSAQDFITKHRKELAALLTNRKPGIVLSDKEVNDILSGEYDDILFILEISNLMLLELRTYDSYLNQILDKAYDDIDSFFVKKLKYSIAKETLRDIIDTRIDLLEMTDELNNTTRFVGEWYIAKLFKACSEKFHFADWETSITKKLSTMSELYMLLNNAIENRKMLGLEYGIVLLFIVDLLVLVLTILLV